MRIDKIEFKNGITPSYSQSWTSDDQSNLEKSSVIRYLGKRIDSWVSSHPVVPPPSEDVLSTDTGGRLSRVMMDRDGCVYCKWNRMYVEDMVPGNWKKEVDHIENIFFSNALTSTEFPFRTYRGLEEFQNFSLTNNLLFLSKIRNTIKVGKPGLRLITYYDIMNRQSYQHQGYVIPEDSLFYESSEIEVSEDGRSAWWDIRFILKNVDAIIRIMDEDYAGINS